MARRILIVDDEAPIRRLLQMALEAIGDEVGLAADGPSALQLFADGARWDAVLLDQRMPGMDGLQILARLKERNPLVPVIMVTAYASIELAVDAMKLGASDFIRKPLTPDTLRHALDAAAPPRTALPTRFDADRPPIGALTMNGFRIVHQSSGRGDTAHRFRVLYGAAGAGVEVTIPIDPSAVERINRLASRHLDPAASFWKHQAEKLLAAYLWSEGRIPAPGSLVVRGVSREDLRAAETWPIEGAERK